MSSDGPSPEESAGVGQHVAYDKAKWHYGGDFPRWTPRRRAYVHTGFFLVWLVEHGMVSDLVATESARRVAAIRARRGRPSDLYVEWDGVLASEMLNDLGNAFARDYYEQRFLEDYAGVFPDAGPYGVRGSWQEYERLAPLLHERFDAWRSSTGRHAHEDAPPHH
ncbi:hypothetical protein AB6N23_09330 [Cellulomonas sp. 179-A 9B4 NHS]|uniref:DUF7832 domain-containing protein n=1 Tax=Cellulomonas sp. 179-A 9B4 NHS TaxID=3142379 RepID=UPI0039A08A4B